jgi:hypothetical protein
MLILLIRLVIVLFVISVSGSALKADQAEPNMLIEQVVEAVGGEEKLLKLFRFRERVLITSTPAAAVTDGEKENRTSVVQVGSDWWIGENKGDKDKIRVLCHA